MRKQQDRTPLEGAQIGDFDGHSKGYYELQEKDRLQSSWHDADAAKDRGVWYLSDS